MSTSSSSAKPNPGPLPFSIRGSEGAEKYGQYYWSIGLSDGREAFVLADRVEVTTTGALICWQDRSHGEHKGPLDPPEPTLGFAAGQWTCFYAASVLGGDPVAIDSLAAPGG
jgi:hypothetical protein